MNKHAERYTLTFFMKCILNEIREQSYCKDSCSLALAA